MFHLKHFDAPLLLRTTQILKPFSSSWKKKSKTAHETAHPVCLGRSFAWPSPAAVFAPPACYFSGSLSDGSAEFLLMRNEFFKNYTKLEPRGTNAQCTRAIEPNGRRPERASESAVGVEKAFRSFVCPFLRQAASHPASQSVKQ